MSMATKRPNENRQMRLKPSMSSLERRVGRWAFREVKLDLIRRGDIDPTGLSAIELDRSVANYIRKHVGNLEFHVAMDYMGDLRKTAKKFAIAKHPEFAVMMYATWVEHWFNQAIVSSIAKRNLSQDEQVEIVRNTQFKAKMHLLPLLCDGPLFSKRHRNKLVAVTEARNSFVHYKWKTKHIDTPKEDIFTPALKDIEGTIEYLRRYEKRFIYKGFKVRWKVKEPKSEPASHTSPPPPTIPSST